MESPIPQEEPVEPLPKPREQPRCYRRRHIDLTETDPAKRKVEYRVKYNAMRKAEAGKSEKYITVDVEDELVAALAQVLEKTIEEAKPLAEKLVLRIKLNRTEQASKNTLLAPFSRCATCPRLRRLVVPLAPKRSRAPISVCHLPLFSFARVPLASQMSQGTLPRYAGVVPLALKSNWHTCEKVPVPGAPDSVLRGSRTLRRGCATCYSFRCPD
ncbi:hypothetical protein PAPYR_9140 [Paratrimastix pyriformis]|uniref:Uncharacterized protein n=1 Tax=Paratrimastix pyriformis TaxID=342808 RepID=A0ABQ8U975_9EUKA|nr:hypothetical protein PAPYR_9140 [Paratrimastix pyriformis]